MYRSLVAQTLHYFSRPHQAPRRAPIDDRSAWRGPEVTPASFTHVLGPEEVAELDRALVHARKTERPLRALRTVDVPLPRLARSIDAWRDEIANGRGFVVLRGFPVERWGPEDAGLVFYGLGLHLGIPGAQNPEGDLLGQVRDTGADAREVRAYRTASRIAYHCDAADLVGLMCLEPARRGGTSRIASSTTIHNLLLAEHPELVDRLYRPFLIDTHGEGGIDYFSVPACRHADGRLRTFWHSDYFRSAHDLSRAPAFDADELAVLDAFDAIASRPEVYLDMELEKGDVQLLSNHTVVHARTAYEDDPDPRKKRHLLRLWVSLGSGDSLGRARSLASLLLTLLRARLDRRRHGPSPRRPG